MKSIKALSILLLIGIAATIPVARAEGEVKVDDEYEDVEETPKGFLLVRRKLSEERPSANKPITVTVELYNAGTSAASKIKISEQEWPADRFETSGSLSSEVDSISPGASYTYSYTITPQGKVAFVQRPTIVTYIAEDGGKQLSTSGPWLHFQSLTTQDQIIVKALEVGATVSFGLFTSLSDWVRAGFVVGSALALYFGYSAVKAVSDSRKKSKRKSALKALGVDLKDE